MAAHFRPLSNRAAAASNIQNFNSPALITWAFSASRGRTATLATTVSRRRARPTMSPALISPGTRVSFARQSTSISKSKFRPIKSKPQHTCLLSRLVLPAGAR